MDLAVILNMISAFLGFFGALCLFLGFLTASELTVEELGAEREMENEIVNHELIQKAVLQTGSFLLTMSFIFKLLVIALPHYSVGFITNKTLGVTFAGIVAFLIFSNWLYFNRIIVKNFKTRAEKQMTRKRVKECSL